MFTALFSDPDLLRDLYCALGGVNLPPDVPVSINTLENVLYMDMYNDISFEIGGKLIVLIEHQSTVNPNIALRMLMYISRVLEKRVKGKSLYSDKKLSVPWPEFYVIYDGQKPCPGESVVRLSDLFEKPFEPGPAEKLSPLLELEVKVININEGKNEGVVKRCKTLSDYSLFISKIYSLIETLGDKEEAVAEAVKFCHKHGILKEFLEIHGSEVLNMLLEEWNIEDAKEVWREEAREEGLEQGREEGLEQGREQGLEQGREEGLEQGREQGVEQARKHVLELIKQGLSIKEIENLLSQA